jgi:hypothetical protein
MAYLRMRHAVVTRDPLFSSEPPKIPASCGMQYYSFPSLISSQLHVVLATVTTRICTRVMAVYSRYICDEGTGEDKVVPELN